MKRKFLVVIPARKGSKGIPNKNFLDLNGKSVIEYTIDHAKLLMEYCDILISTDNFEYLKCLVNATDSGNKIVVRNSECSIDLVDGLMLHYRTWDLSKDDTSIMKVLDHLLTQLDKVGKSYLGILLLQPTVPFRSNTDKKKVLHYLQSEATVNSSYVTFKRVGDCHPARMYESSGMNFKSSGFFPFHQQSRRQDLPSLFVRDGCYYFIGRDLVDQGLQVGESPQGYVRHFPWTINLDEQSDLIVARASIDIVGNQLKVGE